MTKIHLLMRKEDIKEEKIADGKKLAVVLDVLLATTTIVSALKDGAKEVIPVLHSREAMEVVKEFQQGQYILAGELDAYPINGFDYPSPILIGETINGKSLILSTTNGTVALRNSSSANKVYVASLLNNPAVAASLQKMREKQTILIICSGNSGEISLEDFYGAGHLIDCLLNLCQYELTDAAKAAVYFYRGHEDAYEVLLSSYVGKLLGKHNHHADVKVAASKGITSIVPILKDGKVVIETTCSV
ncbi:putative 2-phosphosulfolactate phosphatase [Neobacillus rhizosphaerae]|uniref:Probable 2-phosphosulfolactate phosphatase n=1 Tax=Neobacillus rhizosphaerae TaxID=2880965 RepID=A0ABN8KLA6_9BACI|nr:2-phosphosulfolactate phosphatase [Neobacillus rhizosphaerae]CAH2714211.1 putative 2-phosphosulfolactate phosphatase [Neobacillus rhizosphaerae]